MYLILKEIFEKWAFKECKDATLYSLQDSFNNLLDWVSKKCKNGYRNETSPIDYPQLQSYVNA